MSFSLFVAVVLGALGLYAVKVLLNRPGPRGPLPPGPRPKPVLGNISDLPPQGTQDWIHWLKHKETYGPISSITVMGQTIVVLNDAKIAIELLGKRSSIYSSRPSMVFASEMVGWEHTLAMQTYSSQFRAYRKAMQPYLGSESAVAQFNPLQELETHRFLLRVLEDHTKLSEHIQTEAGAVILKIAYGYTIEPHKRDPLVHMANVALDEFSKAATPGTWLVDIIPALKHIPSWLPGAGFKRTAQLWKHDLETAASIPYAFVRRQMEEGRFEPSYLSNIFKTGGYPSKGSEEELVAKWTAASLYTGGADTTVSAVECFFLAMTLYPEVQLGDRPQLPYIEAVLKEALRWHPVAPTGIPHASTEDDTWGEYFIPKGSLLIANIWAFTHDPEVYHDPMTFKPERFLGVDGREPEMDPHELVFGYGRRICPGRILADTTLYLSVAQSLTVFNISKAVENGKEVDVQPKFQPGVISHPESWNFHITPRTAAHETLIRSVEQDHPWEQSNASDLGNSQS